jgi:hypothetical protein
MHVYVRTAQLRVRLGDDGSSSDGLTCVLPESQVLAYVQRFQIQ